MLTGRLCLTISEVMSHHVKARSRSGLLALPPCQAFAELARTGSRARELVLEPVPHLGAAEREIVALTVLRAALFGGEDTQRLVGRSAGVVERLRVGERNLLVVCPVGNEKRAAHLLHHPVEAERLEALERVVKRVGAQNP